MKKQIANIGLMIALALGAVSAANAAGNATVNIAGHIAKATCDVNSSAPGTVDLGNWSATDFPPAAGVLPGSAQNFTLTFDKCSGGDLAKEGQMMLQETAADQAPALSTAGLWGDRASVTTNVGIQLTATNTENPAGVVLTPDGKAVFPLDAKAAADGTKANTLALSPVTVKATLNSTSANTAVKSGDIKSSVVFSAVYN